VTARHSFLGRRWQADHGCAPRARGKYLEIDTTTITIRPSRLTTARLLLFPTVITHPSQPYRYNTWSYLHALFATYLPSLPLLCPFTAPVFARLPYLRRILLLAGGTTQSLTPIAIHHYHPAQLLLHISLLIVVNSWDRTHTSRSSICETCRNSLAAPPALRIVRLLNLARCAERRFYNR
jgi:hypothetical protein